MVSFSTSFAHLKSLILFVTLVTLFSGCTGKINNESSIQSAVESMAAQNSISLISNSTQSQNKCEVGNKVVLQVALSSIAKYYCRDSSTLMNSVKLGPICDGGVTIVPMQVDNSVRDCHELTLCGKKFDSVVDVTQRIDGTAVQQYTFNDVPWGCNALVEASTSEKFDDPDSSQSIRLQVLPPSCPFCQATNGVTCKACSSSNSSNMQFVAGQFIPITCGAQACAQCRYPPNDSPTSSMPGVVAVMVDHAGVRPFYTRANTICGQTCTQVQQVRVCNNGAWVAGSDINFPTQCQEPNPNLCTAPSANSSVANKLMSGQPALRKMGAEGNGIVTCSECQSGGCETCTAADGFTIGYKKYSQLTVPFGSTCSSFYQCQPCTVGGLFQGGTEYQYGACTVLPAPCTQKTFTAPFQSGSAPIILYNGGQCEPISLQCISGVWKNTVTAATVSQAVIDTYTQSCELPKNCTTAAGIVVLEGVSKTVFSIRESGAPNTCYNGTNNKVLDCRNGQLVSGDPGVSYKYESCELKKCEDPRNAANKINAGVTVTAWSVDPPNCSSLPTPQEYCDKNKVTLACPATGGTAVITPITATNLSAYVKTSCTVPDSCLGCRTLKNDVGYTTVDIDKSSTFFKSNKSDLCQSIAKTFTCKPGTGGASAKLIDNTGAAESDANYPFFNCSPTGGVDEGSLGGTGGGTGNDNGPGSALKKRFGESDGGGGPGGPCADATNCGSNYSYPSQSTMTMFTPCLLPWPGKIGEIEFYGSVIAFKKECVILPDRCSNLPLSKNDRRQFL